MVTKPSRRVPPLAIVIVLMMIACVAIAVVGWKRSYVPPHGGPAVPEADNDRGTVMPKGGQGPAPQS